MAKDKIIVVSGPTASGKSDIAIALARRFNGEIISADSRQVYRGMDIGTGKVVSDTTFPSSKLQILNSKLFYSEGIRHHLIDVASPKSQYSVARFKRDAQRAIRDIVRRGKLPIICGGTGFWIDALVYDLQLPDVKPNAKLRAHLRKLTPTQLYPRLKRLDPTRAATIDRYNPVRLVRALEIIAATGRPVPAQVQSEKFKVKSGWDILYLGISIPKEKLARRIEKRLDARLRAGMVAEVRRLHEGARLVGPRGGSNGVSWKRLEAFGLEYRWVARYLQMKNDKLKMKNRKSDSLHSSFGITHLSLSAMRSALLSDIIAYAKRQLTWWRKNPNIQWIENTSRANRLAIEFLN